MNELPSWFFYVASLFFGLILGSFANVCIVRMPKGQSVVWPRSNCPECGYKLKAYENIPVLSFLFLRGMCSHCKRPISFLYPVVELLCAALSVYTWWYFGNFTQYLAYYLFLVLPLVIVSFIDLKHLIIPDSISVTGIFVGCIVHVLLGDKGYLANFLDSVFGIVAGGVTLFAVAYIYEKIKKQEGLGGGDVKLAAMLGAFFGWKASFFILFLSSITGTVVGLAVILLFKKDMKYAIPYGPFIAFAGLCYLFFGDAILAWYLGLF